jgi:nucleoside-diphosphate-sugar epimerase
VDPNASKQKAALIHLLAKVKAGEEISVYTGDQWRNWLHVSDVCAAINLCLREAPLNDIVHIGAPRGARTIDLINHAIGVTGSKSRVTLVAPPRFHSIVQVPDFWYDTTKLRSLGFTPSMDPYQAVERVLASL